MSPGGFTTFTEGISIFCSEIKFPAKKCTFWGIFAIFLLIFLTYFVKGSLEDGKEKGL
jgi:hypothetical protein